jgi:hypothetical protein
VVGSSDGRGGTFVVITVALEMGDYVRSGSNIFLHGALDLGGDVMRVA